MDSLNYSSDNAGKMLIGERKKEERKREKREWANINNRKLTGYS